MRVAVVGAGIAGASTARFLAKRGHGVVVFEQFPVEHDRGSSHGVSRIIRKAYPDAFYSEIMAEAYPLWNEFGSLLSECGLLYFGLEDSANMASLASRHPVFRKTPFMPLFDGEIAVFEAEAGWVNADLAVKASLEMAVRDGAEIRHSKVNDISELRDFDAVVIAAGPWIRDFVPVDVQVTLQTFAYLAGVQRDGPVWIEDGPCNVYGFPTEPDGSGIKMALHRPEIVCEASTRSFDPTIPLELAEFARRRFGLTEPVFERAKTCLYANTAHEDFRWGRLGGAVFWVTACSGHGFKFGPWIGRKMADFVEGVDTPESIPRFCSET